MLPRRRSYSINHLRFCFLRASQPRAAGQVFSKKHGVVIPAHAGIQDSCDRGKRHWAPAYAGATIDGVASVLFLESFSAPCREPGAIEEAGVRHLRSLWSLLAGDRSQRPAQTLRVACKLALQTAGATQDAQQAQAMSSWRGTGDVFLESFSAPNPGPDVLPQATIRHPRACGDPVIWPLLQVRSGPPPPRGRRARGR